jgi:hypothetical protein
VSARASRALVCSPLRGVPAPPFIAALHPCPRQGVNEVNPQLRAFSVTHLQRPTTQPSPSPAMLCTDWRSKMAPASAELGIPLSDRHPLLHRPQNGLTNSEGPMGRTSLTEPLSGPYCRDLNPVPAA